MFLIIEKQRKTVVIIDRSLYMYLILILNYYFYLVFFLIFPFFINRFGLVMVINATFNNICVISIVEETALPGENHCPAASH